MDEHELKSGDRVWALYSAGHKRRAIVLTTEGAYARVRDAFGTEEWRVALVDCTPIVDSGNSGAASTAHQRELFQNARRHLAKARRLIKGEE